MVVVPGMNQHVAATHRPLHGTLQSTYHGVATSGHAASEVPGLANGDINPLPILSGEPYRSRVIPASTRVRLQHLGRDVNAAVHGERPAHQTDRSPCRGIGRLRRCFRCGARLSGTATTCRRDSERDYSDEYEDVARHRRKARHCDRRLFPCKSSIASSQIRLNVVQNNYTTGGNPSQDSRSEHHRARQALSRISTRGLDSALPRIRHCGCGCGSFHASGVEPYRSSFVDVSTVAECDHDDEQHVIFDRVDDAVVTDAHPPCRASA